jgi:hypothetical protein
MGTAVPAKKSGKEVTMTGTYKESQKLILDPNASYKEKQESLLMFYSSTIDLLEKQEPVLTLLYNLIIKNNLGDTYNPNTVISMWSVIKQHVDAGKQIIALVKNASSHEYDACERQHINETLQNARAAYEKLEQEYIDFEKSFKNKIDEQSNFAAEFQKRREEEKRQMEELANRLVSNKKPTEQ